MFGFIDGRHELPHRRLALSWLSIRAIRPTLPNGSHWHSVTLSKWISARSSSPANLVWISDRQRLIRPEVLEIAAVHQLDVRPVDVAENSCAVYQQTESG